MECNHVPRRPVTGREALAAMAPFTKREFRLAMVAGVIAGAGWKMYHWGVKRDIVAMNRDRLARLRQQQTRYDNALAAEKSRLGL